MENSKITVEQKFCVDDKEICNFRAVFNTNNEDISFSPYQIDKAACKEHRKELREAQAKFEDDVYKLQEQILNNQK